MIYAYTRLRYQVSVNRTIGPLVEIFDEFLNIYHDIKTIIFFAGQGSNANSVNFLNSLCLASGIYLFFRNWQTKQESYRILLCTEHNYKSMSFFQYLHSALSTKLWLTVCPCARHFIPIA